MLIYLQVIETSEDRSKFEAIYLEYRGLAYHVAFKRLCHVQDAEDIVQHVFMKIAENIKKVEPISPKTKRLIVTMVENRVIDVLRVRGNQPVTSLTEDMLSYLSTQPEGDDLLAECILKLPEQQRQVIWLKYYHGYRLQEISKILGISLSWAQKLDQRAKKKLKELYREGGGSL